MDWTLEILGDLENMRQDWNEFVVWLDLPKPLSGLDAGMLAQVDPAFKILEVGESRDMRLFRDERTPETGDYRVPIKMAIAIPTGAQAMRGMQLASQYVSAIGQWTIRAGKVVVGLVIGKAVLDVTDPKTGPSAMLRVALPLILLLLLLYKMKG